MTDIDIPSIQVPLRDRTPCTAQELPNRIAKRLSEKPQTAGSSMVQYTYFLEALGYNKAAYILGQATNEQHEDS